MFSPSHTAGRNPRWRLRPWLEQLEDRTAPAIGLLPTEHEGNDTLASANVLVAPGGMQGAIGRPGDHDWYSVTVSASARLTAFLGSAGSNLESRLTLVTATGRELLRSDATPGGKAEIDLHVTAGTYYLKATAQKETGPTSTGGYQLLVRTVETLPPFGPIPIDTQGTDRPVAADLNGDGKQDLVAADAIDSEVVVLLNDGDGSFRPGRRFPVGDGPTSVAVADFTGDDVPDIVTANVGDETLTLLRGIGDGNFVFHSTITLDFGTDSLVAIDVNGDGAFDLAWANQITLAVTVLLGHGDGTFDFPRHLDLTAVPFGLATGDVNRDDWLDFVTFDSATGDLVLLRSTSTGDYVSTPIPGSSDSFPLFALGDVDGDGDPDLVTSYFDEMSVRVQLGNGDGTFGDPLLSALDFTAKSFEVADVDGDGWLDLVVAVAFRDEFAVLLGKGDGTFAPPLLIPLPPGVLPIFVPGVENQDAPILADFDGDGKLDLALPATLDDSLTILLGTGDGSFAPQRGFAVGTSPLAVASGDLNGDGKPDLVTANSLNDDVSVLLGNGDGTFAAHRRFPVGNYPAAVTLGDVNGDGKPDLVVVNQDPGEVSVLLGNGDGTFGGEKRYPVGYGALSVVIADVDRDLAPDILVANGLGEDVSLLRGDGRGGFANQRSIRVGNGPSDLEARDIDGDLVPDLLVTLRGANDPVFLHGNGDGSFGLPVSIPVGMPTAALAFADVDRDDVPDLVTANFDGQSLSILRGRGNGFFDPPTSIPVGFFPGYVLVGDLTGDGLVDLITSDGQRPLAGSFSLSDVTLFPGNGDGTFRSPVLLPTGSGPVSGVLVDVSGDGRIDLVTANGRDNDLTVILGGLSGLESVSPTRAIEPRHTPLLGDVDRDGIDDVVVLDNAGNILVRQGLTQPTGGPIRPQFTPPHAVDPAHPVRDVALFRTPSGWAIAATDVTGASMSIFTFSHQSDNGPVFHRQVLPTGTLPVRIAARDLDANGLDDLVVANALGDSLTLAFQQAGGGFALRTVEDVGIAPSDITFADLDGDKREDILLTNRGSGDVVVLYGDGGHTFGKRGHYRAGSGLLGTQVDEGLVQLQALAQPVSLTTGQLAGDRVPVVVVVNRGTHSASVLIGTGAGLSNPVQELALIDPIPPDLGPTRASPLEDHPGQIVSGDFDGDQKLDVAILMQDRQEIWLYFGRGDGTLSPSPNRVPARIEPTGLGTADVDDDGVTDLLVGNRFGDLLLLKGSGRGEFAALVRDDLRVPFATTSLDGDANIDVVLARQADDLARSFLRVPGAPAFKTSSFSEGSENGLIGPADIASVGLDGRHGSDLILANTGGNSVLVYLRQADGTFASTPLSFFTGTNPIQMATGNFNADALPDLAVVNQGSNDVRVLLGQIDANGVWSYLPGPRLTTPLRSPDGIQAVDTNGDGIDDIVVTSGREGKFVTLPGIGSNGSGTGFFRDNEPVVRTLPTGEFSNATIIDSGLGFALDSLGRLVRFDPSTGGAAIAFASTGSAISTFGTFTTGGSTLVFAAIDDGSISLLTSADGATYTETASLGGALTDQGSELAVLQTGSNAFELYLTLVNSSQPIVIEFGTAQTTINPAGTGEAEGVPVNASFLLAATLLTNTIYETVEEVETESETFNPLLAALLGKTGNGGGGEEELGEPDDMGEENEEETQKLLEFLLGVPEALDRIALEGTEPPARPEEDDPLEDPFELIDTLDVPAEFLLDLLHARGTTPGSSSLASPGASPPTPARIDLLFLSEAIPVAEPGALPAEAHLADPIGLEEGGDTLPLVPVALLGYLRANAEGRLRAPRRTRTSRQTGSRIVDASEP